VWGFGLRGGDLGCGGYRGGWLLSAETTEPQFGTEFACDGANGCDQEPWQIEGFAGFEAREDALWAEGGVVAALFHVLLAGQCHQR
jgi:hypothetical protein